METKSMYTVRNTDVLVLGAGPGGYVAAIKAAQLGKNVLVVDKATVGGVCLNCGCIPSKALISAAHTYQGMAEANEMGIKVHEVSVDFQQTQVWKQGIVKQLTDGIRKLFKANKVEFIQGEAKFVDNHRVQVSTDDGNLEIQFEQCVIATGSTPIELPFAKFGGRILSSTEALSLHEIPRSLAVVGGGYIGIELSQMYANFGCKVTIIEGADSILTGFDARTVSMVKRRLKKIKADVVVKAKVSDIAAHQDRVAVTYTANDAEHTVEADYVLVTVGRRPNTAKIDLHQTDVTCDQRGFISVDDQCRTSVSHIFAIGDVTAGPALAHRASYQAKVVGEVICGHDSKISDSVMPLVVFSDPEIASVGLTEKQAQEAGYEVSTGKFTYGANGRALSLRAAEGSVTIVADKSSGRILGAQIIGLEASTLIAECALAIQMQMTLEDLVMTIHAHPTLSEVVMEAAEVALGQCVHAI